VDAVAGRLHAASIHLSRRLRAEDEALGLSASRLSALSVLASAGPMRIGDLAHAERVEPPTMTRLVDALEREGHVVRSPDPADRRAVLVRATAKGSRALGTARARRVAALARGLRRLSPAQLRALARGVEILERAVE
jgi:DNA-binding MarR family transcriptional regulator